MNMRIAIVTVVGCVAALPILGLGPEYIGSAAALQGRKPPKAPNTEIATFSKLPSLGSNAEAHAVNESGTVVAGHSFDRAGYLYAVRWTLQNGSWVIATLPYPGTAARASGIDNQGNVVGYAASSLRYPLLWPVEGGYRVLGCDTGQGAANGISADGQVIVGQGGGIGQAGRATAWQAPQSCTEDLAPLEQAGFASASAVNGDGSIIGGRAARNSQLLPVRWLGTEGQRHIYQLDSRPGSVRGANASGDLAGYVTTPCALEAGCQLAVVWYADGGLRELDTLGGAHAWALDINAAGEVVGMSTSSQGTNTAFFWSLTTGMFKLPANKFAVANAVSDVRSDGTRLVVGMDAQANAAVWVVRNP